jgi:hypothetical protein
MPNDENPFAISEELGDELSELIDDLFGDDDENENPVVADYAQEVSEDVDVEAQADNEAEGDYPETDVVAEADDEAEQTDEAAEGDDDAEQAPSDEVAELEDAGEEPADKYTVKVNGSEREVTADELIASYQKATAADEKFRAAADKERELDDYVTFATGFAEAMQDNPAELLAEYAELADDPNAVIVAIVERVAASGKLHPQLAEALGVDDRVVADARAKYAEQRAAAAEARVAEVNAERPDDWGYTPSQYQDILSEILTAAGLGAAGLEQQRAFVAELAQFRAEQNIANPYLAYAQMREARLSVSASEAAAAAAATAVTTATKRATSKAKRIPAASASAGQRTAPAAAPGPIYDHKEAAAAAYAELFGDN